MRSEYDEEKTEEWRERICIMAKIAEEKFKNEKTVKVQREKKYEEARNRLLSEMSLERLEILKYSNEVELKEIERKRKIRTYDLPKIQQPAIEEIPMATIQRNNPNKPKPVPPKERFIEPPKERMVSFEKEWPTLKESSKPHASINQQLRQMDQDRGGHIWKEREGDTKEMMLDCNSQQRKDIEVKITGQEQKQLRQLDLKNLAQESKLREDIKKQLDDIREHKMAELSKAKLAADGHQQFFMRRKPRQKISWSDEMDKQEKLWNK